MHRGLTCKCMQLRYDVVAGLQSISLAHKSLYWGVFRMRVINYAVSHSQTSRSIRGSLETESPVINAPNDHIICIAVVVHREHVVCDKQSWVPVFLRSKVEDLIHCVVGSLSLGTGHLETANRDWDARQSDCKFPSCSHAKWTLVFLVGTWKRGHCNLILFAWSNVCKHSITSFKRL